MEDKGAASLVTIPKLDMVKVDKVDKTRPRSPSCSPTLLGAKPRKIQKSTSSKEVSPLDKSTKRGVFLKTASRVLSARSRNLSELNMLDSPRVLGSSPENSPREQIIFVPMTQFFEKKQVFERFEPFSRKGIICNFTIIIPLDGEGYKIADTEEGAENIYDHWSLFDLFDTKEMLFQTRHGLFLKGQQLTDARIILRGGGLHCN